MDILYSLFGTVWGYRRLRTTYKTFPYTPPQISPALLRHSHCWLLPVSPRVRCRYLIMAYRATPRASSPPVFGPQLQSPWSPLSLGQEPPGAFSGPHSPILCSQPESGPGSAPSSCPRGAVLCVPGCSRGRPPGLLPGPAPHFWGSCSSIFLLFYRHPLASWHPHHPQLLARHSSIPAVVP